jgi:cbb3-type cytochrome oxidase subunit 3
MEINYFILVPVFLVVVLLLVWLYRRNNKDEQDYEQDTIGGGQRPDRHPDAHI